jgi:hypothetical protein
LIPTCIALLNMSAECGSTAQFDGAHRAPLGTTEGAGMDLTVLGAAPAEDVRHFERRSHREVQKYSGAAGAVGMGSGRGRRSKGLVVAHTVLVATLR